MKHKPMLKGDGQWRWWWGLGRFPEEWVGPFSRRADALADFERRGLKEGVRVINAERAALNYRPMFDARATFARFMDVNRDALGARDIVPNTSAITDLQSMLEHTFMLWLTRHAINVGDRELATIREDEYIFPESERKRA